MRRLLKFLALVLAVLLITAVLLGGISAVRFYSPVAEEKPCQGCTGDASLVRIDGFGLYYREIGSDNAGVPIVVIHGGPGHSSESFHRSLDFLAEEYRVVYYDQRGSGHSEIKPDPSFYTIEALVYELDTLRREVIASDRIILLAHSAGGALAQRYALAHPGNVSELVLVSSVSVNNGVSAPLLWDSITPVLFALGPGLPPSDPAQANAWFGRVLIDTSVPRLFDPSDKAILQESGTVSFVTWREVSRSLEGSDYQDALTNLSAPTLATFGVADGPTTGRQVASSFCDLLPDCQLVEFQQSGHWPFLEEPERFAQVVLAFLAGQ